MSKIQTIPAAGKATPLPRRATAKSLPFIKEFSRGLLDEKIGHVVSVIDARQYKQSIALLVQHINELDPDSPERLIRVTLLGYDESLMLHCYINTKSLYIIYYSLEKKREDLTSQHSPIYTINDGDEKYPNTFERFNIHTELARLSSMTAFPDWIETYSSSSYHDSVRLIHTLGGTIAEATRFFPIRGLVGNSIARSTDVLLTEVVHNNAGSPLSMKNRIGKDVNISYIILIRNWQALSASCTRDKSSRVFHSDRMDKTDAVVTVRHPDHRNKTKSYPPIAVSSSNTPERAAGAESVKTTDEEKARASASIHAKPRSLEDDLPLAEFYSSTGKAVSGLADSTEEHLLRDPETDMKFALSRGRYMHERDDDEEKSSGAGACAGIATEGAGFLTRARHYMSTISTEKGDEEKSFCHAGAGSYSSPPRAPKPSTRSPLTRTSRMKNDENCPSERHKCSAEMTKSTEAPTGSPKERDERPPLHHKRIIGHWTEALASRIGVLNTSFETLDDDNAVDPSSHKPLAEERSFVGRLTLEKRLTDLRAGLPETY